MESWVTTPNFLKIVLPMLLQAVVATYAYNGCDNHASCKWKDLCLLWALWQLMRRRLWSKQWRFNNSTNIWGNLMCQTMFVVHLSRCLQTWPPFIVFFLQVKRPPTTGISIKLWISSASLNNKDLDNRKLLPDTSKGWIISFMSPAINQGPFTIVLSVAK